MTRHTWDQINNQHEGETRSQNTWGTKQSWHVTYRPPPGRCALAPQKHPKGRGGWELWRRLRRRTDTREGAGRQRPGRCWRREEPGKRQEGPRAGGAQPDPGHSHDDGPRWSRRREEPWRRDGHRPTAAEQVVEEPEVETESQRARGMPRIRGARVEPRALVTEAEAEIRRSAAEPERLRTKVELAGGRSPTEPVGWSDEAQPEERSPEAMAGRRSTKAEPEGWGSPVELVDRWVTVEVRELGAEVEPLGLRTEAESGPRRLEAEVRETPTPATLEDGSPVGLAPHWWRAEGEQRGCQTTAVEEAGAGGRAGIFEERALEGILEERALEGTLEARSWLEPADQFSDPSGGTASRIVIHL